MFNKLKTNLKRNQEIVALILLILITVASTSYYNYIKNRIYFDYKNTINNIYLKKTIDHLFNNLEPKFKTIKHKVLPGETFNNILERFITNQNEIDEITNKISSEIDLNKLNTNHQVQFTIDQSNNLIREFIFHISSTEKIHLSRDLNTDEFNRKLLVVKLKKKSFI